MRNRGPDRRKSVSAVPPSVVGLAMERRRANDRRLHGFISRVHLFSSIPYSVIEDILAKCTKQDVAAGAVLLEPGQVNNALHLLISGRLRIHLDRKDSADFIAVEAGDCFGELSIIDGRPVSAYVVAEEDSQILLIEDSLFWERLIPEPGVARNLLKTLSERMRQNRDMIIARMQDKLALEHLQRELSIAHTIQLGMLPSVEDLVSGRTEIAAFAIMEPAKNVGGDFYDAFFISADRLFVSIGDVSGKGVPAALFMARAMTQMRMEAVRRRSPSAVLEAVNKALCAGNDTGMFVTLFCGMLDLPTGHFSFANAGHNPPLLLAGGERGFLKVKKGLVAGIIDSSRYPADSCQLAPGDSLLLYTDGVTEAMNSADELYSEARFLEVVRCTQDTEPKNLVGKVRAALAEFVQTAPQADDITLLSLQYRGFAPADSASSADR